MGLALGQLVISKAGRDKGRNFLVIGSVGDLYVLLADGDLRRVEKPKKKKIKHLIPTDYVASEIQEKLVKGVKISNSEIKKALKEYENKLDK